MVNFINEFDIMVMKVEFDDGSGGKKRPVIVVNFNGEDIAFFKITSQYENKSEYIQSKYFEILDYVEAGLTKRSWIDTVTRKEVSLNATRFHVIGRLSNRDIIRFIDFLKSVSN